MKKKVDKTEKIIKKTDVAIIGGGVIGASIAYHLAMEGISVSLFEKNGIASGASGTNLGHLVSLYRAGKIQLKLALEQFKIFPKLSKELDIDIEYKKTGGMVIIKNQQQYEILSKLVKRQRKWGLEDAKIISSKEAYELEPALSTKKFIAAAYSPFEGKVNPLLLTTGYAYKAHQLGANIFTKTKINGLKLSNKKIESVLTENGEIKTKVVICAAGAWSKDVCKMVGLNIPIEYHRGEAMATQKIKPTIFGTIVDGDLFVSYIETRGLRTGACLAQSAAGNVLIAQATTEGENYKNNVTYKGLKLVAKKVLDLFPSLENLEVIRMWAGVTPYTLDRFPVFGYTKYIKNFIIAASFPSALLLAPAIGRIVTDLILKGRTYEDISEFSPNRFI